MGGDSRETHLPSPNYNTPVKDLSYKDLLTSTFTLASHERSKGIGMKANPTVRVIQQCSKQSFQPHHPGVSETPPLNFFFFAKFIGKMLYFSVKKGIIHSHRYLNSVSSSTDKTNLLVSMPSRLRSPAPRVRQPPRATGSSAGGITSLSLKPAARNSLDLIID
jgi:hypothetical protein